MWSAPARLSLPVRLLRHTESSAPVGSLCPTESFAPVGSLHPAGSSDNWVAATPHDHFGTYHPILPGHPPRSGHFVLPGRLITGLLHRNISSCRVICPGRVTTKVEEFRTKSPFVLPTDCAQPNCLFIDGPASMSSVPGWL